MQLRAEGLAYSAIGARLGISKGAAIGLAKRLGLVEKQRPELSERIRQGRQRTILARDDTALVERARQLWANGWLVTRIAEAIGLSIESFRKLRHRHGGFPANRPISQSRRRQPNRSDGSPRAPKQKIGVEPVPPPREPIPRYVPRGARCEFPIGHWRTPGFRWCDAPVEVPGPYCSACRDKAYLPGSRRGL